MARVLTDEEPVADESTEEQRVIAWRLHELLEAGYGVRLAERIAARLDIDLHTACEVLEQGCSPALAGDFLL